MRGAGLAAPENQSALTNTIRVDVSTVEVMKPTVAALKESWC